MARNLVTAWVASALAWVLAGCTAEVGGPRPGESTSLAYGWSADPVPTVDVSYGTGTVTDAEVDCWWREGVRHVVVATNNPRIARQQLEQAVAGGMTVDVYVYLYWERDVEEQVHAARAIASQFPVGILWLDAEDDPGGLTPAQMRERLERAVDACGDVQCGIYTRGTWWTPYTGDSQDFTDLPLWYARYGTEPDLSTWSSEAFGGWERPWGKQYGENTYVCGLSVDLTTMRVSTSPSVPRTEPEPPGPGAPRRPSGLEPDAGDVVSTERHVRLLCDTSPGAETYELEVEYWNGSAWRPYTTFATATNAKTFTPVTENTAMRWRARAGNGAGWSPWSARARFDYGYVASPPPDGGTEADADGGVPEAEEPDAGTETETEESDGGSEESDGGAETDDDEESSTSSGSTPTNLTPDGELVTGDSVTLSFDGISGATVYEIVIEYDTGGSWSPYYTYETVDPSKTFYPAVHDTSYRWRAHARVTGAWGLWSDWASFDFD